MKITNYCKIGIILISLAFLSACADLEVEPYGQTSFLKTPEDLVKAMNSFHAFTYEEGVTGRGIMWFENCSDNLVTGRSQPQADQIKNFMMGASNGRDVKDTWPIMEQLIVKANNILANVDGVKNLSPEMKQIAIGQSHFYRAFAYLWLAPYYGDNGVNGGIPIYLETTPAEQMDSPRPESVLENYDMIIDDMRKAANLLPYFSQLSKSDYGRPHKAAAWAFTARAALYAAQYDSKYYAVVIEMCDNVINMAGADKRELFDDNSANPFANLFREQQNFCSEYIFSMLGNKDQGPKFHGISFQNGGWGAYNTWGYFQPTLELYKAFEPGDTRREATILYPGDKITFVGVERTLAVNPEAVSSTSGMLFRKFMSPWEPLKCKGTTVNTDTDNASNRLGTVLIRFSDILLMKAEAQIWTKGEGNAEAKTLLNRIRKRARLPENSPATKAELKNQRRCELAFEFMPSRHLDLVRWGDAKTEYAKELHGVKTTLAPAVPPAIPIIEKIEEIKIWNARNFDPAIHHVFPIPSEIIGERTFLKQNVGY